MPCRFLLLAFDLPPDVMAAPDVMGFGRSSISCCCKRHTTVLVITSGKRIIALQSACTVLSCFVALGSEPLP